MNEIKNAIEFGGATRMHLDVDDNYFLSDKNHVINNYQQR